MDKDIERTLRVIGTKVFSQGYVARIVPAGGTETVSDTEYHTTLSDEFVDECAACDAIELWVYSCKNEDTCICYIRFVHNTDAYFIDSYSDGAHLFLPLGIDDDTVLTRNEVEFVAAIRRQISIAGSNKKQILIAQRSLILTHRANGSFAQAQEIEKALAYYHTHHSDHANGAFDKTLLAIALCDNKVAVCKSIVAQLRKGNDTAEFNTAVQRLITASLTMGIEVTKLREQQENFYRKGVINE